MRRLDGKPVRRTVFKGKLGEHLRGQPMRSSHLGYDCYRTGSMNGDGGRVRIPLRAVRLPSHIRADIRAILPIEMWWPQPDHAAAHACIDAVMTLDVKSMQAWKDDWPEHTFGFENYMAWCRRKADNREARAPDMKPSVSVENGRTIVRSQRFPTEVLKVAAMTPIPHDRYVIRLSLVTFTDRTTALRVTLVGRISGGAPTRLSRAYIDVVDQHYEVIEHYPGRYRALKLPEDLIYAVLGVRRGKPLAKIVPEDLAAHDPRPAPGPLEHADRFDTSDVEERRVEGRRTSRVVAAVHADTFDSFPAAPGG